MHEKVTDFEASPANIGNFSFFSYDDADEKEYNITPHKGLTAKAWAKKKRAYKNKKRGHKNGRN